MSLSNNYPSTNPSLSLDFANTKTLDPRITFTRASTATYYDASTTAKAEENLLLRSQEINLWTPVEATVGTNTDTAPDGTTTAEAIKENSVTQVHRMQSANTLGFNASTVYTMSAFVKQKTGSRFATIGFNTDGSNYCSATFDLSAGTNTQTLSAGYTSVSATITASVNSWYRVTITATTNAASTTNGLAFLGLSATSTFASASRGFDSYAGDNTSEILYWGAQLEQRSSVTAYTPTTTQPITNYIPVLLTAQNNVPRFEHNPVTRESLGLEIEEQRTNLLTYSDDFADAAWTKSDSSIINNTVVAPNGILVGDKLIENTANAVHLTTQTVSTTSGTTYTYTVYAKAAERTALFLRFSVTGFGALVTGSYNLSTQTATIVTTGTATAVSITPVGNGWFRCSLTSQATATGSYGYQLGIENPAGTRSYTGNGYSGIYIWGAQLEVGAFPTSYIPTVASQVTRSADAASMTGTNFSSWFNNAEGTLYAEYSRYVTSATSNSLYAMGLSDNGFNNIIGLQNNFGGTNDQFGVVSGGAAQATISVGTATTAFVKKAGAYRVNSFQLAKDGTLGTEDTSGVVPTVDRMGIGSYQNGGTASEILNGTIKKLAYYPIRLTNAQIVALTTV